MDRLFQFGDHYRRLAVFEFPFLEGFEVILEKRQNGDRQHAVMRVLVQCAFLEVDISFEINLAVIVNGNDSIVVPTAALIRAVRTRKDFVTTGYVVKEWNSNFSHCICRHSLL